ncbi:HD-GYP domain-containing protein [Calidifontibacillus oryziterrae]|uniref:HD-GYP domain-containing protein n=1 Tax=Calidifontibacillus oryziterrae TaxID=1191699 RepID=UPI0002F7291E|nr:HD-GYP domain-containing protein [Calidifontibacillus oryziterrae]
MRLISTNYLQENMTLGKSIFNEKWQVLISEGVPLTKRMIDRLIDLGITYVYIEDPQTDDIEIHEPISERSRREAIETIQETFDIVKDERRLAKTFVFDRLAKKFSIVVRDILSQVKSHKDVISLLADVCAYDNYIFTHSLNVTIYSLALGMELNLSYRQLEELGMGAMLHDVGKRVVPSEILSKPGKLTNDEFDVIKKHAEDGFSLLRHVPNIPLTAAHCAYQHHERLDGSGYPRGLAGADIHYYSRILAIADVYDAVTSNRVYRKAMLPQEGLEILYAGAGTKFEIHMVEAFRRAIAAYPVGLTVRLSDGRRGVVIRQNPGLSDRPVIRIFDHDGKIIEATYELDLKDELAVVIVETDTSLMSKK